MKRNRLFVLAFVLLLAASCGKKTEKPTEPESTGETETTAESVAASEDIILAELGTEVVFTDKSALDYYRTPFELPIDYSTSTAMDFYVSRVQPQKNTVLKWTLSGNVEKEALSGYKVRLSRTESFRPDSVKTYKAGKSALKVNASNLYAGQTYYWDVTALDKDGNVLFRSPVSTFTTAADQPRLLCTAGIENLRDIGGKPLPDGTYTRQGVIFRSAQMDNDTDGITITQVDIDIVVGDCGVRTDVDYRGDSERPAGNMSPLGQDVRYLNPHPKAYFPSLTHDVDREIDAIKPFARAEYYPILFHCAGGLDRTGTVGTLLELAYGVSEEYAVKDYEMSTFMLSKRLRNDTNVISYPPDSYALAMKYLKSLPGDTLQDQVLGLFDTKLHLTPQEIDNIVGLGVGNEAVFAEEILENVKISKGDKLSVPVYFRASPEVTSVMLDGKALSFETVRGQGESPLSPLVTDGADGTVSTVTVDTTALPAGNHVVTFDFAGTERRLAFTVE